MKRYCFLITLLILGFSVFAQQEGKTYTPVVRRALESQFTPWFKINKRPALVHGRKLGKKKSYSGTYNFLGALINANFGNVSTFTPLIYPDSITYIVDNQGTPVNTSVRLLSIGSVFDPKSEIYEFGEGGNLMKLTEYDTYVIDSVSFPYLYYRPASMNPNIVDTLIFQFYGNSGAGGVDTNRFTGSNRIFSTVLYDRNTKTGGLAVQTDTLLLNEDDTATFPNFRSFSIPVDYKLPANSICAATVTFFPGYAYDVTDTLVGYSKDPYDYKLNHFRVIAGNDDAFTAKTYNHALIYLRDQRAGHVGGYFANHYYPGNGFINLVT